MNNFKLILALTGALVILFWWAASASASVLFRGIFRARRDEGQLQGSDPMTQERKFRPFCRQRNKPVLPDWGKHSLKCSIS